MGSLPEASEGVRAPQRPQPSSMINGYYSIAGIFSSHHHQPGDVRRAPSLEGDGVMRQLKVKKSVKREPARTDALPIDPRDADVVRAKRRLYERRVPFVRRDR